MSIYRQAVQSGATNYNILNVEVDTAYNFGDGNHDIKASGSETDITTGNGNCNIKVVGTGSDVKTGDGNQNITHYGSNASITTGKGNQKITSIGDDKTIYTDSGDDEVTFIGENCKLDAGNGDNKVVFWGNNATIRTGDGNDDFKTFDQIYDENNYDDITAAFIAALPTGVWEDWTKLRSNLIDKEVHKSLMSKTTILTYEDVYNVDVIFSRYINGLKNVNIDMGDGKNTADLTVDIESAKLVSNGKDVIEKKLNGKTKITDSNVKINDDWSLDEKLDSRKECKLRTDVKTKTRAGGVFVAAAAAVAAVALTVVSCGTLGPAFAAAFSSAAGAVGAGATAVGVAGTIGAAIGTAATVAGAAMTGVGLAQSGYNIATGQAHSGDWVNLVTAPCSLLGVAPVTTALIRGGYAASQKDYIGAALNFSAGALSLGEATGVVKDVAGNITTTGNVLKIVNTAAKVATVADKTVKVANGENSAFDLVELGMATFSAGQSINSYINDICATPTINTESTTGKITKPKDSSSTTNKTATVEDSDANFVSKTLDYLGNEFKDIVSSPGTALTIGTNALSNAIGDNSVGNAIKQTGNAIAAPFVAAGNVANKVMDGLSDPAGAIESISTNFMNGFNGNKTETKSGTNIELTEEILAQIENDALAEEVHTGNFVSQKIESSADTIGDVAGGALSVPGKILGGITSVLGNNLLGTDNWIGNGTIWLGDQTNNLLSWGGEKIDGGIESTGSVIAHPIDSYNSAKDYISDKLGLKSKTETTTPDTKDKTTVDTSTSVVTTPQKTTSNSFISIPFDSEVTVEDDVIV